MTLSDMLEQPCNKSDNICSKLVDNLGQAVRAQLVDSLFADLLQDVRFLRVRSKSANKPSTTCVSTYCPKLSTSLEQLVTTLLILLYLLQGCSNKSDTVMI
jgi:hypothetical protein